jgi:uncharacterized glyoxalase superfamily protein PhnB
VSTASVRTLGYISFYLKRRDEAVAFYRAIFGEPTEVVPEESRVGWRLGDTWLTFFPSSEDPRNAEFAIEVDRPEEVDRLFAAFIAGGATSCSDPQDTRMYERMRYCCLDDPFGIRVDIYHPLGEG